MFPIKEMHTDMVALQKGINDLRSDMLALQKSVAQLIIAIQANTKALNSK